MPETRRIQRDPRLPVAELFDPAVAQRLWDGLPDEFRQDHFDKMNLPDAYRSVVVEKSVGGDEGLANGWTSAALNMRGLPEPMTQELAWLVHREAGLGLRIYPGDFNGATLGLRLATRHGSAEARAARSLLALTPAGVGAAGRRGAAPGPAGRVQGERLRP